MVKRIVSLVAVLLPGCVVDTPVVEGEQDRLGKDLGAWCASMCDRFDACDDAPPDDCASTCVESFTSVFVGKSSACQQAGLRVMDCVDGATCETSKHCSITEEEDAACSDSADETTCQESFISRQPTQGFDCAVGFNVCSDGKEYSLDCVGAGDSPECTCAVSGRPTGRFSPSALACPSAEEAIQICGWPIFTGSELPPTNCGSTAAELPFSNPAECAVWYDDCDGRDLEVRCVGTVGNVVCECNIDGQTVGSYESPYGICPFIEDPDSGSVAANYGCGFKIAP
jgi:hypothetical protein